MKNASSVRVADLGKVELSTKDLMCLEHLRMGGHHSRKIYGMLRTFLFSKEFKSTTEKVREELKIPIGGFAGDHLGNFYVEHTKKINKFVRQYETLDTGKDGMLIMQPHFFLHAGKKKDHRETLRRFYKIKIVHSHINDNYFQQQFLDNVISEYVIFGTATSLSRQGMLSFAPDEFSFDADDDGKPIELSEQIIKFEFPLHIKEDEVHEFVTKNWKIVKTFQHKHFGQKASSRIKPDKKLGRDIYIYNRYVELIQTPKDERDFSYPEIQIVKELKSDTHVHHAILDTGTVKSIIHKITKMIKTANS